jgi:hypothetical protein
MEKNQNQDQNDDKQRELEKDDHTPRKATGSNDPSHHEPGPEAEERVPPRDKTDDAD